MNIYNDLISKKKTISITGLGYIGLPLALEFAKYFKVIGFDKNLARIKMMQNAIDPSKEINPFEFERKDITFTNKISDLKKAHFHIIAVPTDIDEHKVPDLSHLKAASKNIGKVLKKGDYVIFESTVYPSCTEEDCLPIIENESGLKGAQDFKFGYSPERINPGDKNRTISQILKIVAACDEEALKEVSKTYGKIIKAGIYEAPSIKVAEAAKVIENTQRDLNISLMNELAIIFDKLNIDTSEVIKASATKWNFHNYHPGLVGGHCISVDPYYLIHKAKQLGIDPQVIAAGRRVNDYIPHFIAKKIVTKLIDSGKNPRESKVLIMGVTFKENVSDIRNSKVFDLIKELQDYSIQVDVVDPLASKVETMHSFNINLMDGPSTGYDGVVVAVGHKDYRSLSHDFFKSLMGSGFLLFDLKGLYRGVNGINTWSL